MITTSKREGGQVDFGSPSPGDVAYNAPAVEPETPTSDQSVTPPAAGPWSSTWVRYYDQASRRRHQAGGYKRWRAEARRKRKLELLVVAAGAAGVIALFGLCCAILTR